MNTQSFTQRAESPVINSAGQRPAEEKCRSNPQPQRGEINGITPRWGFCSEVYHRPAGRCPALLI